MGQSRSGTNTCLVYRLIDLRLFSDGIEAPWISLENAGASPIKTNLRSLHVSQKGGDNAQNGGDNTQKGGDRNNSN